MKNNAISAIEEQFKKDCTIIELRYEYPNYTGIEKYAIISDLDQSYIEETYASELIGYKPYVFMTGAFLEIRRDFRNNNKKFEMGSIRSESLFSFEDSDTEEHHSEITTPDFVDSWIQSNELKEALKCLSDIERQRVVAYYIVGKTNEEIGEECGCSEAAVRKSIAKGIEKLSKFYEKV